MSFCTWGRLEPVFGGKGRIVFCPAGPPPPLRAPALSGLHRPLGPTFSGFGPRPSSFTHFTRFSFFVHFLFHFFSFSFLWIFLIFSLFLFFSFFVIFAFFSRWEERRGKPKPQNKFLVWEGGNYPLSPTPLPPFHTHTPPPGVFTQA